MVSHSLLLEPRRSSDLGERRLMGQESDKGAESEREVESDKGAESARGRSLTG